MLQLAKRIEAACRRHGPVRFVRFAAYNIWYQLRLLRQCVPRPNDQDAFDEELGTHTAQIREIGSLDIDALSARHAVRYQASPAALVRTAISSLDADLSDMVFVDFGSGKGRVVMIAASFPFKAVIGVELSSELHQIAMENVRRAAPRLSNIQRISIEMFQRTGLRVTTLESSLLLLQSVRAGSPLTSCRTTVDARIAARIPHLHHLRGSRDIGPSSTMSEAFDR